MEKIKFEPLIKEIYRLSKKVSADLPFHATGIEKQLQEALAYEFRKASKSIEAVREFYAEIYYCLLYTSPSPRDSCASRMPSSA